MESLENDIKKDPTLQSLHSKLLNTMKSKSETLRELTDISFALYSKDRELDKLKINENNEDKLEEINFIQSKTSELMDILYEVYIKYLEHSSNNVLGLGESGVNRYPAKHSFFACTTQETEAAMADEAFPEDENMDEVFENFGGTYEEFKYASLYCIKLANEILNGNRSIEHALLETERLYRGYLNIPAVPTHRLSTTSSMNEDLDFEVLFITGSQKGEHEKERFIFNRYVLKNAIQRKYGDKCKAFHVLDEPNPKDLEKTLTNIAGNLKGKKLYIFFIGHGNVSGKEDSVLDSNSEKQGAMSFFFRLKTFGDGKLHKDRIKRLYNEALKDIEVITIFETCHGGAGITAIENKGFKNQIDCLA